MRNTLYAFPIAIVVAILFAASLAAGTTGFVVLGKKLDAVKTLDAAVTAYDGLITASDAYVTSCAEHQIDQSCVPIAQKVFAAAESTKSAYNAVKTYGCTAPPSGTQMTNADAAACRKVPQTVGDGLMAAVNILQNYFVQG